MGGVVETVERRVEVAVRRLGIDRFTAPARAVRAVEFGAVGATGTAVNAVVFLLAPVAYFLAGVMAFFGAAAWTFVLNWIVTYSRPSHSLAHAFGRYASVYVLGFVIYSAVLAGGVELFHVNAFVSNLAAIVVAGTANFTGTELFALGN